ncbi:SDR family oxidoreductase [Nocardia testacea]|uniref:SDR family oxidoreductase n=1 Tax=Nocardia testacea TaxID=248551 RepID=A0ABW7VW49_9NOCA
MIVVTGATGNVGSELVRALTAAGEGVAAVSRRPGPLPDSVRHRAADLGAPEGLRDAFDGADALFLLVAGDDPDAILGVAKEKGVQRVVLMSSQGAGTRPAAFGNPLPAEQRINPDVAHVLGRAPRALADWATRTADAFR